MPDRVSLALVGAGRMGCTHLRALAGSDDVSIAAVIDPVESARRRAAAISPGARIHPTLDQALSEGDIDGVLIAAPSPLHLGLVEDCAKRHLPILCEKPCGTTSGETATASTAADAAGVVLQIGYWRRFVPALITLRERIRGGDLGQLALISCWQWDARPASAEFRRASGGLAVDMGVHEFDQIRWLTGAEPVSFAAVPSPITSTPPIEGHLESLAMMGALSTGTVAFVSLGTHFRHGDCVWLEVMGTADHARVDVQWGADGEAVFFAALRAQAEDFGRRLRTGQPGGGASADDALRALEIAENATEQLAAHHASEEE